MLSRAYSFLHVKAIDDERRIITGTATTPTPDRMGDVVEPLGVSFRNPLPLLLYHNTQKPVGWVKFQKPTKDGIAFEAKLPTIEEPGTVRDRIEEAWVSIKSGLLAGVSIGFRSIEEAFNKDTKGFRFLKTEVVELSLVAIPAQPDARIDTIKSLDIGLPASGTEADRPRSTPSGVSDTVTRVVKTLRQDRHMPKKITDQIKEFEATRQAKSARMTEIMEKAGDEGVTLDTAQTEEYDGLDIDVKSIDAHLVRLEALEKTNKAAAKPVHGDDPEKAAASRGTSVITVKDTLPPGTRLARFVMCKAQAFLDHENVIDVAKARYPHDAELQTVLKTAVAGATTIDATWAGPLVQYQNFSGDFIEFLRPATIVGKFGTNGIPSLRRVPFNVRIPRQTSGGSASWVGQGAPKPLTKFDFDTITMLWSKLAAISVLTQELVRFSTPAAEGLVRDSLRDAILAKQDTDFVDPSKAAVTNVSPASITNGITPTVATGTNAAAFRTDFATLMAGYHTADLAPDAGVFIMSSKRALALSMMLNSLGQPEFPNISMKGGSILGFPVIVSNYVDVGSSPSTDLIIFVNASDIYLADDGQVVISVSDQASLQMDDAPTNNAATGTGTSVVSMFQTNSIAIRAERFINWQRRRTAAVAYISNAAYTA